MEEIVQALVEEGALVRNGTVKLTRSLDTLKIPPTVQAILASRIDRLPADEKELLQTLAVIGSEFPLEVVRKMVQLSSDQLDHSLSRLQTAEFIYEQPALVDIEYRFKHALTQDEAYNSLLTDRRKLLHERTAQAIEASYPDRLEDHYQDLAHHYRLSGNALKAIEYLRLVGEQAMDRGAYAQAVAATEPALNLIERLPEATQRLRAELGVRLLLATALPNLHGMASAERLETAQRVCELSEQLGDDSALIRGLLNLGFVYGYRGETLHAREIANRCLALAEQNQDLEMLPSAQLLVAVRAHFSGELLEAASRYKDLIKRLVSAPRRINTGILMEPWVAAPLQLAGDEQLLGRPYEALGLCDEALRRATQINRPYDLVYSLMGAARVRSMRREPETAHQLAGAARALAEKHVFLGRVTGVAILGWAKAELGQTPQALAEWASWAGSASPYDKEILLPQVCMRAGRVEQALEMLNQYLAHLERSGARFTEAEVYRLKGEAILMRDSSATAEAEKCFRKAIEIARGQSAKWWELRATTSLARLLRDTDRRDEASAMLAEIYNWFTEGFDTADLKDAKALLDELSN
jgi:tetratricopeptide (TPR) repeat protein